MFARNSCRSAAVTLLALLAFSWAGSIAASALPKGHYLSFPNERNLKTEMQDVIETPGTVTSYQRSLAEGLDDALRTPGVKGLYMAFHWRTIEVGDGKYNWAPIDDNIEVARRYGLKLIVKISDRSFNGVDVMPAYFPREYVLWTTGGGKEGYVAKRWDPWVYTRMIRLYKSIASRYAANEGFGGIATTETAIGNFSDDSYTLAKYRAALTDIVTRTQEAMPRGELLFYLNFIKGGDSSDMNKDTRVSLLRALPHDRLVIGAPDVTPDVKGMPRSATNYRIHARKAHPELRQFCHAQHVDQGLGGINVKSNVHRQAYFDEVANVRERERQSWFTGAPAVFEFDDLRAPDGVKVDLHPESALGQLWTPAELLAFGWRNFQCDYFLWHYREWAGNGEFGWRDVKPVIVENPCFYEAGGCTAARKTAMPNPPAVF